MRQIFIILFLFILPLSVLAIEKAEWTITYSMWDEKNKTYNLIDLRIPKNAKDWIVPNMAGEWTCEISLNQLILKMRCNNFPETFQTIAVQTSCNPLGYAPDLIVFNVGINSIMFNCDMN